MKKLLVALALASAASGASATTVTVGNSILTNAVAVATPDFGALPGTGITAANLGQAYTGALTSAFSSFTATYLGQAAGFANYYMGLGNRLVGAGHGPCGTAACANTQVGLGLSQTITVTPNAVIDFSFATDNNLDNVADANSLVQNGDALIAGPQSRGILFFINALGLTDASGKAFDFLIGYDDKNNDNDFNDFVVGVTSVPVPAALPLLASALAAFGIARRKSKQA